MPATFTESAPPPPPRLRVIDAHHHIWEPGEGRYPWMAAGVVKFMGDTAAVQTPYRLADFRAEAETAGLALAGSVHLQCGRDPADPMAETAWVQAQAEALGHPIAIVGYGNPAAADFVPLIEKHRHYSGFRGIRHMLNWGESEKFRLCDRGDYLQDPAWRAGLKHLARLDLSFDLQINPWQLRDAAAMAQALPDLRIILNHAGLPFAHDSDGWQIWHDGIASLAAAGNTRVKFSGIGMADRYWNAERAKPIFGHLLEKFGPRRMMFASNFPIDRLYGSYGATFGIFRQLASGLSPDEQAALFHDTAAATYRPARA